MRLMCQLGYLVLACVCMLGCEDLLGIESRSLDIQELTVDGYEGCEPADGICDGCTSTWHQCICEGWKRTEEEELRAQCASKAPEEIRAEQTKRYPTEKPAEADAGGKEFDKNFCSQADADTCTECLCDNCDTEIVGCLDENDCSKILNCVLASDCDTESDVDATSCEFECASVIDNSGGLNGVGMGRYRSLAACLRIEACPCNDGPEPVDCTPESQCTNCSDCIEQCECDGRGDRAKCEADCAGSLCTPANSCDCGGLCLDRCVCEGGSSGECQEQCKPASCSVGGGCDCGNCESDCLCRGSTQTQCDSECNPPACMPANSCEGCDGCFEECLCDGKTVPQCELQCPPATACSIIDSCVTCDTCLGKCACEKLKPLSQCMVGCGTSTCKDDTCGSCSSCTERCDCQGQDPFMCRDSCLTTSCPSRYTDACELCGCDLCPQEMSRCEETPGCLGLADCFNRNNCLSLDECNRPGKCLIEIQDLGGLSDPRVGVVEALLTCRLDSGCACAQPEPPAPIFCGSNKCFGHTPLAPDPVLSPCCVGSGGDQCGLDMDPVFGFGTGCAPINRQGVACTTCPSYSPGVLPWLTTEVLPGCCSPSGRCGYLEFTLGLGCAEPIRFGILGLPPACTPTCP